MNMVHFYAGLEENLAKIPLRPGTIYFTKDTNRLYFDTLERRERIAFNSDFEKDNDIKENEEHGENTIQQIEDQSFTGSYSSFDSRFRRDSGCFDLSAASYESFLRRFRGGE